MRGPLRTRLRAAAGRILQAPPFPHALRLLERADAGARDVVGVLTYHRVEDPLAVLGHPGLVSATPDQFAEQVTYLADRFQVVAMDDLLEARAGGRSLPQRAVLVTFDDAYRDFAERAWPVLRSRGVPVTLFVPTGYPDRPDRWFWWDWLHAAVFAAPTGSAVATQSGEVRLDGPEQRADLLRDLRAHLKTRPHAELLALVTEIGDRLGCPPPANPVLGWDELRSLAGQGVTLAPHSRTHPLLDRVDPETLDAELTGAIVDLEREIGPAPRALAYPSGSTSPAVREAAQRAGYEVAFTTRRGLNRLGRTDWLALHRINVGLAATVTTLRAQLGRWALAWSS